jgi:CubicO group peptidase (beta-lactamase class C family)
MIDGGIPSITVALTNRDGEVWSAAFGESNLWAGTPATTNTVYLIGSTFKAQSTVALLQQMEQGKFDLDDAVHDYLDIEIRGEDPADPVRFRHLLTHTSGLPVDFGPHLVWGNTAPLPLDAYMADSLRAETAPLQGVVYSNMAYSLAAYLVEQFSGVPYKEYIREHVWGALGMTSTAFDLRPSMEERLAIPYVPDERTKDGLVPTQRLKANAWPAGIVYGTIHDQARWVSFNLRDGTADGTRLLTEATIEEMQSLQYEQFSGQGIPEGWGYEDPGYGLTWWTTTRQGESFFAHSGSVPGYTAFVMGNRTLGHGVVFLTNGHRAHPHLIRLSNLALDLMAQELTNEE